MLVTVTKVISDAQPGDVFSAPSSGDRLHAVPFRLGDTGSAGCSGTSVHDRLSPVVDWDDVLGASS